MQCPKCQHSLESTERKGVVVDYCPGCRGVWLDSTELAKVIERTIEYEAPPSGTVGFGFGQEPAMRSGGRVVYGRYHARRRARHPLRELFDVFE